MNISLSKTDNPHPQTLHEHLLAEIPRAALKAIATIIAWRHVQALEEGVKLFGEVGRWRNGTLRWIGIEADIMQYVKGGHPGVDVEGVPCETNGMMHVEVSAGSTVLHVVHDADPDAIVPKSDYGQTAASTNTGWLPGLEPEQTTDKFCAVLFHSKGEPGSIPARLEIRFPDGKESYATEHLRLYAMFPSLLDIDQLKSEYVLLKIDGLAPEEQVKDDAHPTIRPATQVGS